MFLGMSSHTIDSKGRIVLPAKFREELGDTFYIAQGFNQKCVQVMSSDEYERISANISELSAQEAMALQYIFTVTAETVSPNAQGRIVIPQALREKAGLENEALVLGMNKRIEIWSRAKYDEFIVSQQEIAAQALLNLKL